MASILSVLEKFRSEVPHFVSSDVVEIDSGMSLAGLSADPNFDAAAASASYAEVVKANSRALDLLGIGATATEDILITTGPAYILIRMLGKGHYHGVAISRAGTLGFARTMMQRYAPLLLQALNG